MTTTAYKKSVINALKVELPYQGPHKDKPAHKRIPNAINIPLDELRDHELEALHDPLEILLRKVTHLAQLLDISEQEAERVLFARIGQ